MSANLVQLRAGEGAHEAEIRWRAPTNKVGYTAIAASIKRHIIDPATGVHTRRAIEVSAVRGGGMDNQVLGSSHGFDYQNFGHWFEMPPEARVDLDLEAIDGFGQQARFILALAKLETVMAEETVSAAQAAQPQPEVFLQPAH